MNIHEPPLRGTDERARLDGFVRAAAAGSGAGVRIVGERGMGKSSALAYAIEQAAGFRVLRLRAVAAESEIPYAGLHLLCADLLDDDPYLPAAGRHSLGTTLGLTGESRSGAAAIGSATLELLGGIAESQPVCIAVDDAHALDAGTAEVLAFVAGHVSNRALLVLIADNGTKPHGSLEDLPALHLKPLSRSQVQSQLVAAGLGPIDDAVAERVLAESGGNVGILADSLRGLMGGFAIPPPHGARECSHENYAAGLTPEARLLLLAAAADPTGDVTLFRRVASDFGADSEALTGFLTVDDRVIFGCPGLRSVSYYSATPDERRLVHRKLGANTVDDPTWRTWHLGLAAAGHDDALADELEKSAGPAQSRGGTAARAAFLEKAVVLTGVRDRRADRALAASAAMYDNGDLAAAQRVLAIVETEPLDAVRSARHIWHRARIETAVRPGVGSAQHLLHAARQLRSLDASDTVEAYLEALLAAMSAAGREILIETANEARAATADHLTHPVNQILYGIATRILDGYAASVGPLRAAISAFRDREPDPRTERWLGLASLMAVDLWDEQEWTRSSWQGREPRLEELLAKISENARGHNAAVAGAIAVAVLHNAAGRYEQAVEALREAMASEHPGFTGLALPELVEAAARTGDMDLARDAAARLATRTSASGTDWAIGVQATAEALLADGQLAEAHYELAIERLSRTGVRCQLARAELLYGEWLRRQSRRIDARVLLRAAHEHFTASGAVAFAGRARGELLATGEAARKRTADSRRQLTPQEKRVVSLAKEGFSNAEIAEQMFVSTRTVEYHLYKAFARLGINSRAKLKSIQDL